MGLYLIVPTLLVIFVSFLVVRAGGVALSMTGMDLKKARFQALSAFSGTGFTTRESELIVNNPRRRRIVTWLIILGNAGIVTVIVSATSSVVTSEGFQLPISVVAIIAGAFVIYKLMSRTGISKYWENFIKKRLIKSNMFEEGTIEDLVHVAEDSGLVQATIFTESNLIGRSLIDINSDENPFWIVSIKRGKNWISLPKSTEIIETGDKLIVYGDLDHLRNFFKETA
ncbi:TrkA C-terminal domain-containing protein [Chloroflexota bacterium]